jgi:16S rRNA (cytidine1402-2'-O)-methyltransferase
MKGILYFVGTPLGNLEDITLRALRILKEVDLIAAEDTRRTRKLLSHYQLHTPLTSYHEYNKKRKGNILIKSLLKGKDVALVSDSGMPGISDPGYHLVQLSLAEDIKIVPIPGPTALITGLAASGLPTDSFLFLGFLSPREGRRKRELQKLKEEKRTIVIYESPHRILKTLGNVREVLGDREAVIARELTKKFEEITRGRISELLREVKPRGEITLIIKGNQKGDGGI